MVYMWTLGTTPAEEEDEAPAAVAAITAAI
jgi:hypothetical protein